VKHCPNCKKNYPSSMKYCPEDQTQLTTSTDLEPGMIIREKYEVLSRIGAGGMAEVYRAKHLAFNEMRAIKVVNPKYVDDESFIRRFKREAVVSRKLRHPHAIDVEDLDTTEDGRPFIVMEVVNGPSLRAVIEDHSLGVDRSLEIACQVAEALAAAHRIGITHRDIKPENIILTKDHEGKDFVKVLDFGIAKVKEGALSMAMQSKLTMDNMVVGTPQYMSPEQAEGKIGDDLDGRADIYSLGIMLYEMLTGSLPFQGSSLRQWRDHQLFTVPAPPRLFKPALNIPVGVSNLVMKAVEKKRESRFQSMEEFLHAMRDQQRLLGAPAETYIVPQEKGRGAAATPPGGYVSPRPEQTTPPPRPSSYEPQSTPQRVSPPPQRPSAYEPQSTPQRVSPPPQPVSPPPQPRPYQQSSKPIYIQPNYANSAPGVDQGVMTPPPRVPTPGPQAVPEETDDSRMQKRYPCNADVQVRVAGSAGMPNWGTITEISRSGCYIEMPGPSQVGTALELVLHLGGGELQAHGQVQSYHPPIGMGVMFLEMSNADFQRLHEILETLPPLAAEAATAEHDMIESHTPAPQPVPGPIIPGQRPYQPPRPQPPPVQPVRPAPPRRDMYAAEPAPRSKTGLWIGIGAGAVLLIVILAWILWPKPGPDPDVVIRTDIEHALKSDQASPTLRGANVVVLVNNKIVTLTGQVQSEDDKNAARNIAMKEPGVVDVSNNLSVARPITPTDSELQRDVEAKLKTSQFDDVQKNVKVAVKNKVVTLSGEVGSQNSVDDAATLAGGVAYVASVRNNVQFRPVTTTTTPAIKPDRLQQQRQALAEARGLFNNHKYNQALAKLNGVGDWDPSLTGQLVTLRNEIDAAQHPITVVTTPPVNPNVNRGLAQQALKDGEDLMNKGQYDAAIRKFGEAKKLDPSLSGQAADLTEKALNAKHMEEIWNKTHKQ
jgi:eukaryotic-like serine/threonine-protein kinase